MSCNEVKPTPYTRPTDVMITEKVMTKASVSLTARRSRDEHLSIPLVDLGRGFILYTIPVFVVQRTSSWHDLNEQSFCFGPMCVLDCNLYYNISVLGGGDVL